MRIAEIHSSELTASCMAQVKHRLAGEVSGETTTALYRGLTAGRALEIVHAADFACDMSEATVMAASDVQKTLAAENRQLTDAVEAKRDEILGEITQCLHWYRDRFSLLFQECELLGTEVPARYSLNRDNGDPIEFASHLDLLVRDTKGVFGCGVGRLIIFDWKWRVDSPSSQYLARNMQFALYYLMGRDGSLMCGPEGYKWIEFDESPALIWLHLPSLKPYSRRTVSKDDSGEQREYVKGDNKPIRSILHKVEYDETQISAIQDELRLRAKMLEMNLFPLNPNPVSCRICDAEAFCTRFDTAHIGDSQ